MLKNEEIETLIQIKDYIAKQPNTAMTETEKDAFNRLVDIITKSQKSKQDLSNKSNAYNKTHAEYHHITNNMYYAKKKGNIKKYKYWKLQLEEYKKSKGVK